MTAGPDAGGAAAEEVVDRTAPEEDVDPGAAVIDLETGHPRVDEALARLGDLDALPTAEHADVYEDVHRRLHTALTELDAD